MMKFKAIICREQSETLSIKKGIFYNNSEINTLISKRLPVENKGKLSQLQIVNKKYCVGGVLCFHLKEFRFLLYR